MLKRLVIGLIAALFLPALLASCGSSDDAAAGAEVSGAWARSSPMVASAGAVYLKVTSPDGDEIVGVSVDSSVAAAAELHETVMVAMEDMDDDGTMDHDADMDHDAAMDEEGDMDVDMEGHTDADHEMEEEMGGAMTMQEVASVPVPAGETVSFAPGGLHVMLLDLVDPLELGDEFDVTLTFATAGDLEVTVVVSDEAP